MTPPPCCRRCRPSCDPYTGDARVTGDAASVSSIAFTCEYEGYLYATISVTNRNPYGLYAGTTPGQVVVDIATGG